MAEEKNSKMNGSNSNLSSTSEDAVLQRKGKFTLVELTMIIMLVALVFVFWLPIKADKQREGKVASAVAEINKIAAEDLKFKNDTGFYYDDIKQMDSYQSLNQKFFTYALSDSSTIMATSTQDFGIKDCKIIFRLPSGPFEVNEDDTSKKYIDPYWLP